MEFLTDMFAIKSFLLNQIMSILKTKELIKKKKKSRKKMNENYLIGVILGFPKQPVNDFFFRIRQYEGWFYPKEY